MKKNSFVAFKQVTPVLVSSLLLLSCGKAVQGPDSPIDSSSAQSSLNPLSKGEQLNPISKGEQLNPISKGEQLNPISKGEQLNPGSKGERIVAGELLLLGANRLIPDYALRFFLDGKPLPTDWLRLSSESEQTLRYEIENMPTEGIHILEVRYLDQAVSTMVPPPESDVLTPSGATLLNLNLRSSFVVDTVRFADAEAILRFADWTPERLQKLMDHPKMETLLQQFTSEKSLQTPSQLNLWMTQGNVQQSLRDLLQQL